MYSRGSFHIVGQNVNQCVVQPYEWLTGIIHVLGYTPTEGERGVPITVHLDLADTGVRASRSSSIKSLPITRNCLWTCGWWQWHTAAPPFDRLQLHKSLISIPSGFQ